MTRCVRPGFAERYALPVEKQSIRTEPILFKVLSELFARNCVSCIVNLLNPAPSCEINLMFIRRPNLNTVQQELRILAEQSVRQMSEFSLRL